MVMTDAAGLAVKGVLGEDLAEVGSGVPVPLHPPISPMAAAAAARTVAFRMLLVVPFHGRRWSERIEPPRVW